MNPLGVIPLYVTEGGDVELAADCIRSIRDTEPDVDILVVDDHSPERDLVDAVENLGVEVVRKDENTGFARTVNVGLQRALDEERDAILINADIEFIAPGWLKHMQDVNTELGPAAIVGGLLLYPNGTIQHAGIYFSLLTRQFDHRYKFGPANLPEAHEPLVCPVTAALQFVRHSTLATIGIYDENFRMGWEDVDYCLRAFLHGDGNSLHCVYNPLVRAYHHESVFRGKPNPKIAAWQEQSFMYLMAKYQRQSFAGLVPSF